MEPSNPKNKRWSSRIGEYRLTPRNTLLQLVGIQDNWLSWRLVFGIYGQMRVGKPGVAAQQLKSSVNKYMPVHVAEDKAEEFVWKLIRLHAESKYDRRSQTRVAELCMTWMTNFKVNDHVAMERTMRGPVQHVAYAQLLGPSGSLSIGELRYI